MLISGIRMQGGNGRSRNLSEVNHKAGLYALLLSMSLMLIPAAVNAQDHHSFYRQSLKINNTGMMVLGSWALANITIGTYGWSRYSGSQQYFHQMNLFWNSVNLAIAGFALYSNYTTEYTGWGMEEILGRQMKTQRLFLINAGLDVAYMGTGLLLKRIAYKYPKNESRLTGYGNSVLLQGAFLFVFDLILYGVQRSHRLDFLETLTLQPMQDAWGITLALNL